MFSALQNAGLAGTLSDPSLVATVFAPTDDAFANLLKTTSLSAAQLLNNTDILTQVCFLAGGKPSLNVGMRV